ncbi:MAG: ferredoxin--NADP reductase [Flavobacteriaceae bacterium]|nr:ferredoxin--NADP reductase [Flavobacteriaceae bacterium]
MSSFYKLTVKQIVRETPTAISILFDVPNHLKDTFTFIAGQYVTLKTTINNSEVRRAYSICASPNSQQLKVAVKAVKDGVFSTYATSQLKVGDTIEVSEPEGKFTLTPQSDKNYIAFAAGSGITPVMAMVKATLENTQNTTFTLVYGNKSVENTIFKSELDELASKHSNFHLNYVYSQEQANESKFGRIDKSIANYFLKNKYQNILFDAAFLCGPEKMIETVSETLQENQFTKDQIFFELFTASTDNTVEIKDGKTQVTVLLDDEEHAFIMDASDNILAASLRNNIDAPYSCQGGVCSSCLGKITAGKAVMKKNSILTDSEIEEGLVLTCQAHPVTPKISIDFDDV